MITLIKLDKIRAPQSKNPIRMPNRVTKEVWLGTAGLEPPECLKLEKWSLPFCAPRVKHIIAPNRFLVMD